MITSYKEGKDLYAIIASNVYHNKYEDNKEFYPDGTMNPEGKHRRTSMKSVLLGLMYGRGINSVAEQIKPHKGPTTPEDIKEAQRVTRAFFDNFPNVEKWMNETQEFAKREGYVEDLWGRRRRLPDIQLDKYEVKYKGSETEFNPLLYSSGINPDSDKLFEYRKKLATVASKKDYEEIKAQAARDSVEIRDNTGFIAAAERQAVNARIQGGAASMSKRAMIAVHNDPELKALGFKLVNAVHDELIGEVSEENGEAAAKRLATLMIEAAKPECKTPMKCDADCYHAWYEDVYQAETKEYYEELIGEGKSKEDAFKQICKEKSECTEEQLKRFLKLI